MLFNIIQGHRDRYESEGRIRLPISDYRLILTDILSRTISKLSQISVKILNENRLLCVFEPPLGELCATYTVHLRLIGKLIGIAEFAGLEIAGLKFDGQSCINNGF